ncbi:hypothetical protein PVAP13_9NG431928 [Panicum virgatum]|uniref:Uncharacterized protein n=1 Tax=Panicum virgatum TaxID=38727 RepID=A0A8T0MP73_PANVG|nr:hypothetical protein PVAP13_9NG431928 [Panicum virgatum]
MIQQIDFPLSLFLFLSRGSTCHCLLPFLSPFLSLLQPPSRPPAASYRAAPAAASCLLAPERGSAPAPVRRRADARKQKNSAELELPSFAGFSWPPSRCYCAVAVLCFSCWSFSCCASVSPAPQAASGALPSLAGAS